MDSRRRARGWGRAAARSLFLLLALLAIWSLLGTLNSSPKKVALQQPLAHVRQGDGSSHVSGGGCAPQEKDLPACSADAFSWPALEGYPPWRPIAANLSSAPLSADDACEAYWGHGFVHTVGLLGSPPPPGEGPYRYLVPERHQQTVWGVPNSAVGDASWRADGTDDASWRAGGARDAAARPRGWLRCHFNPWLETSVCEAARVVMHPHRIAMAAGGEQIEEVRSRSESDEIPAYKLGALEVEVGQLAPGDATAVSPEQVQDVMPCKGAKSMQHLLLATTAVKMASSKCGEVVWEPTLLVTRYEYANVYHTITDWYNAFAACHVAGLARRPNVVFLDGHSQGTLDDGWTVLFPRVQYAKSFPHSVCFQHAIIVPLGYNSPIFGMLESPPHTGVTKQAARCRGHSSREVRQGHGHTARVHEFGEWMTRSFGLGVGSVPWWMDSWRERESARRRLASSLTLSRNRGDSDGTAAAASVAAAANGCERPGEGQVAPGSVLAQATTVAVPGGGRREPQESLRVLFIRRENYLAHPRHDGQIVARLANEEEIMAALQEWAARRPSGPARRALFTAREATPLDHDDNNDDSDYAWAADSGIEGLHVRFGADRSPGVIYTKALQERLKKEQQGTTATAATATIQERQAAGLGAGGGGAESSHGESPGSKSTNRSTSNGGGTSARCQEKAAIEALASARGLERGGGGRAPVRVRARVRIVNGTMAHWPMEQQLKSVYSADVILGAHGAGLGYAIFARPGTAVVEVRGPSDPRAHYKLISWWRGLQYLQLHPDALDECSPRLVVEAVQRLLSPPSRRRRRRRAQRRRGR